MQNFYMVLKNELKNKGVTQKQGAEILGISRTWFNRKLNGRAAEFTIQELATLCRKLGININKILKKHNFKKILEK